MIRCKELPTDLKKGEEIRDIDGFDGKYAVTNFGRVWAYPNGARKKGHWKKATIDEGGYKRVGLSDEKKVKGCRVHRLVALAFIPNPDGKYCINHKDFNRENNYVENLEWCTIKENNQYSLERGRYDLEARKQYWAKARQKAWEQKAYLAAHKAVKEKKTWRKMVEIAKAMQTWKLGAAANMQKSKLFKDGVLIGEFDSIIQAAKYAADRGWASVRTLQESKKSRGCVIEVINTERV